jgi:glucan biosynthesis protein C
MVHHDTGPNTATERLHGLDALRGFALLLGVALHAAMAYMPGSQHFWIVSDGSSSLAMNLWFYWIHLFRMLTFFLLAGYFGRLLCERIGPRAFAADRWRRIALPLLIGWPLVFAGIVVAVVWAAWIKGGGSLPQESPPGPRFTPDDFPLTHLWFLYLLLWFYAAALLLRALWRRIDPRGASDAPIDALLRTLLGPWAALLLAVPVAIALFHQPDWYAWFGIPTPDRSLYPNRAALTGFGVAFALGWLIQRQRMLLAQIERWRLAHLALAVLATAACLKLIGLASPATTAVPDARTAAYAFSYGVAGWAWTLALTGLALRHCRAHGAVRRYLADAAYWVYLAHLPLVMLLQVAASQLAWPWWAKYPAVLLASLAVLLGSYQLLVRHTALGRWLNGRRAGLRAQRSPGATGPV